MTAASTESVMRPDETVPLPVLVAGARRGDQAAWRDLVDRYSLLVRSVTRSCRLGDRDAEDVAQTVWLRLLEHLDRIREAEALPGWIATTARHESLRLVRKQGREAPVERIDEGRQRVAGTAEVDDGLLGAERDRAVRHGLAELPAAQRQLLTLLVCDPPLSYQDISRRLGMPIGSIGPTRARSLQRLRGTSAMRAWLDGVPPAVPSPRRSGDRALVAAAG